MSQEKKYESVGDDYATIHHSRVAETRRRIQENQPPWITALNRRKGDLSCLEELIFGWVKKQ